MTTSTKMAQAQSFFFPSITPTPTVGASQTLIYSGFDQRVLEIKQDPNSRGSKARHSCDIIGCTVTFKRSYDLVRHKRTVHGPKVHCPYPHCTYATARSDKMKAHNRKKHFGRGKLFSKTRKPNIPDHCSDPPYQAKEMVDASVGFRDSKASESSWYTNGLEMNELWTGTVDLEIWTDIDWNPFWTMTA